MYIVFSFNFTKIDMFIAYLILMTNIIWRFLEPSEMFLRKEVFPSI